MKDKRISIITINFNNRTGLLKTINSVLNQSYDDFEYIVIDGGSTDGSVDVIKKYSEKISYWVSEKDNGIYHAMNKGVAVAKGDYTLFLNSGDRLYNNDVINNANPLSWTADIVCGNVITDAGKRLSAPIEVTMEYFINGSLPHPSTFIKRSLFGIRPYNENYKIMGDRDFFMYHLISRNSSYQRLNLDISLFDITGISSTAIKDNNDESLRQLAIDSILPERVKEDYKLFMGERDNYHRLFYVISKSNKKKYVYRIVVACLKMVMFNKGWIKNFHLNDF